VQSGADVIALQETKTQDEFFPFKALQDAGYPHIVVSGEKSYNGVAILSKIPIEASFCLEFYNQDKRHIAAKISGIEIHNFYVPAGGDIPDIEENPKFKHKLSFLDSMNEWFLQNNSDNMVLVGDLNIAPFEHDVWSSKQLKNVVSHTNIEREKLIRNMNSIGWVDAHRKSLPMSEKLYSWWSYRSPNWQISNRGRRLDHIWVSKNLDKDLGSAKVFGGIRAWDRPSDHVPVMVTLQNK
jgi:exodeoxyribonuclease-3